MFQRLIKLSTKSKLANQRRYVADLKQLSSIVDVKSEIYEALMNKRPVVALESTIITHGMPYPTNIETAIQVEQIIREQDAVPATIAILKGRIKIGLTNNELMELADDKTKAVKTSRRDFAHVLGNRLNGGTTVAGTIICAELCGIKIFATGGIGGVHRNGENTMDVSADLIEMGRNPVAVVSSGVKSILDIPRTMEFLETQGVFVSTYQCPNHDFPAFYTRTSGVKAPYNFIDAADAASCIDKSHQLGLKSGFLIAVPVPAEHAMDDFTINNSITNALADADKAGIKGKEVTPFILAALAKITAGKSLKTNIALIKNNAWVAAQIAVALTEIDNDAGTGRADRNEMGSTAAPVVIGGSILDVHYRVLEDNLELNGATYKSETKFSGGGVGRNIAEGLQKLHGNVSFISAFGNDQNGEFLRRTLPIEATSGSSIIDSMPTANCAVILDRTGDCKLVAGDMSIHKEITPDVIYKNSKLIERCPLICIDSNLSFEAIEAILSLARKLQKPVFYEPTDMLIAGKPFEMERKYYEQIKFISPNLYELRKIAETLKISSPIDNGLKIENIQNPDDKSKVTKEIVELCNKLQEHVDTIIVTAGSLGIFIQRQHDPDMTFFTKQLNYMSGKSDGKSCRFYETQPIADIVNASGAGDAFCAGFITGMLNQKNEPICVSIGFAAAQMALMSQRAVPEIFFTKDHQCWSKSAYFHQMT